MLNTVTQNETRTDWLVTTWSHEEGGRRKETGQQIVPNTTIKEAIKTITEKLNVTEIKLTTINDQCFFLTITLNIPTHEDWVWDSNLLTVRIQTL